LETNGLILKNWNNRNWQHFYGIEVDKEYYKIVKKDFLIYCKIVRKL